jgi:hypothetical protein
MEIRPHGQYLEVAELDPFLAELLRQIPESAKTEDSDAARDRIYSAPTSNEGDELLEEWKLYVEPELQRLFRSATETVAADLKVLNGGAKPFANCTLRIPLKNADAWLSALNQARLAIAAKFGFTEGELGDHYRSPIGSRRDLSLFQVNFYGFLQECILQSLQNGGSGEGRASAEDAS